MKCGLVARFPHSFSNDITANTLRNMFPVFLFVCIFLVLNEVIFEVILSRIELYCLDVEYVTRRNFGIPT